MFRNELTLKTNNCLIGIKKAFVNTSLLCSCYSDIKNKTGIVL